MLQRDDDYLAAGKPVCDWDDDEARTALIDELLGQNVERGADGSFRIARRVAKDRVISSVDPDARHGHKTQARGFDGYKGHIAIDPDSEIISAAAAGSANQSDADQVQGLLQELEPGETGASDDAGGSGDDPRDDGDVAPVVYGDASYGGGANLAYLQRIGATPMTKVRAPTAARGHFAKDRFVIDLDAREVTCPTTSRLRSWRSRRGTWWRVSKTPASPVRCGRDAPTQETAGW